MSSEVLIPKVNSILVMESGYMFLKKQSYSERVGTDRVPESFMNDCVFDFLENSVDGMIELHDGDLGGCLGEPEHAEEDGRWTKWTCEDMIRMLEKQNLSYLRGSVQF